MVTGSPLVLVVDDEPRVRDVLQRILKQEGYKVITAPDGETALGLIKETKPDVILLDIMMPGLDGFQVLNLIRQYSSIPVIMLTARREVTTARDALILGADDYVRKPFHIGTFSSHSCEAETC